MYPCEDDCVIGHCKDNNDSVNDSVRTTTIGHREKYQCQYEDTCDNGGTVSL